VAKLVLDRVVRVSHHPAGPGSSVFVNEAVASALSRFSRIKAKGRASYNGSIEALPKLGRWVLFPSPASISTYAAAFHFPFFPIHPNPGLFFEKRRSRFPTPHTRSIVVSVCKQRVKQIPRRFRALVAPDQSPEASDIVFDTEHLWHSPGARRSNRRIVLDRLFLSPYHVLGTLRIHGLASLKPVVRNQSAHVPIVTPHTAALFFLSVHNLTNPVSGEHAR